jgi:toxin YoeB
MMGILWEDDAWQEYLDWQTQDKKTLRRINKLIKDIQRTPFDGIGHPEPLSGNLSGWWSRHIDEKNRIVYKTVGNQTTIVSCHGHYNDK